MMCPVPTFLQPTCPEKVSNIDSGYDSDSEISVPKMNGTDHFYGAAISTFDQVSDLSEPEDGLFPVFLPNEVLPQRFADKMCMYQVSQWRLEEANGNCQLCSLANFAMFLERRLCENDHQ